MEQSGPNDDGPKGSVAGIESHPEHRGTDPLQFGPYLALEQIGTGGMGAVYRARDLRLQRDVAVKVLHQHLAISGARERFLREARAVSSLNHPNICTVFDIGEEDGVPYLVMELLEGVSLRDRLEDGPPIHERELERIATQAAMALAAAHAKGIVHRDIKPANLFLVSSPEGETQLKVLDFGLAKLESDHILYGEAGLTRTGATVGTVEYMSPEQARGEDLDPRSDLFSLGAVLYELATGDVPFRGPTSAVIFAELLGSEPVPPRMNNTDLSAGMDAIIRNLLQKKLESRTQSAQDLLTALRALRTSSQVAVAVAADSASASTTAKSHTMPPLASTPISRSSATLSTKPVESPAVRSEEQPSKPSLAAAPPHTVTVTDPDARPTRHKPDPSGNGPRTLRLETVPVEDSERSDTTTEEEPRTSRGIRGWLLGSVALIVLAGGGRYLWHRYASPAAASNVAGEALQIAAFQNSTGDAILQDVPAIALETLLREMPGLHLVGYAPSVTGNEPDAKTLAEQSGSTAYLTGDVAKDGQRYRVHAQIVRTADGVVLASEEADADSVVELPDAFSRLAIALRTHLGETPEEANNNAVPLDTEASSSLTALTFYAHGMTQLRSGQALGAVQQFTRALADDPVFPAARLKLAEALRQAGAEPERQAAVAALQSDAGSPCERANVAYERASATGTLDAAQRWAGICPQQADAQVALAREQLAAGRGAEAESTGVKAAALDPLSRAAHAVATEAMLSQDHYESALKEQQRAAVLLVSSPGLTLLAAYLRGDGSAEMQAATTASASSTWDDQWNYVTYLSNRGRLEDAVRAGQEAAVKLQTQTAATSSATVMRSRVALLKAMAGHCEGAATEAGSSDRAAYLSALADAWCHRPATGLHLSDPTLAAIARGAQTWGSGDAGGALKALDNVKQSAESPVAALLRGEIHLQQKQQVIAIGDYRAVLTRRGAALLTGTLVYPAAQAGLATAYRTMGDVPNSARAQSELETTWQDAAPGEPLLHRAKK